jgi:hypothetical protein
MLFRRILSPDALKMSGFAAEEEEVAGSIP